MNSIKCPICGSNKSSHYFSNEALTLYKCKNCGVKFQHPMPTPEALDKIYSSNYHDFYYPERVLDEQKRLFHYRLNMLERLKNGGKGNLLDIGNGKGMFLKAASERGWSYVGQEFSARAAQYVKDHLGIDTIVCNHLSEANFNPESFDIVHMSHVLEHLYNPEQTIREIYRILKPGGLFYCEVPRQSNLLNFLSNLFGKKDFGFDYKFVHLFVFSMLSLRFLLEQSGFEILSTWIEGVGSPHRYIRGVHYTSYWTHLITKIAGVFRLETLLGGGNLTIIGRKEPIT